jgi:hypothetical protein
MEGEIYLARNKIARNKINFTLQSILPSPNHPSRNSWTNPLSFTGTPIRKRDFP